jgi:hypothetical protein
MNTSKVHSDSIKTIDEQNDEIPFPDIAGATILINRSFSTGLLCYFTTLEEGFEFGHAFLQKHTSELRVERPGVNEFFGLHDDYGKLCVADYEYGDIISIIRKNGWGRIGKNKGVSIDLYTGCGIPVGIWAETINIHILPSGLAMILGEYGRVSNDTLDNTSDPRIKIYMLDWPRSWHTEVGS